MTYDTKTNSWGYDIRSFERYKRMFFMIASHQSGSSELHRIYLRKWMREIQQRWPQFIKEDEVP